VTDADRTPEELARDAQRGSTEAFSRLVERFQDPVFNLLSLRMQNRADAEELAQEAFLRAWQRIGQYDDRWRFSTWLYAIARNLQISHRRAAQSRPSPAISLADVGERGREPSRDLTDTEVRGSLWTAAARVLSDEQRDAMWLRYAEEMSPLEIAHVLGRRPSTVRVLLFRARARLAESFDATAAESDAPTQNVHVQIAGDPR